MADKNENRQEPVAQDTPMVPTSPEVRAMRMEAVRENELLHGAGDRYGIYQIKDTRHTKYAFCSYEEAAASIARSDYLLMYQAPLLLDTNLGILWEKHNRDDRPHAREMRSISMSDVVVLKRDGQLAAFYSDRYGFKEMDGFLTQERAVIPENPLHAAEMSTEDNYNMIDGILNNTSPDTAAITDKPSVVGRLTGANIDTIQHGKGKQSKANLERGNNSDKEI